MDFPINHLLDEDKSYEELIRLLHAGGLCCTRCGGSNYYQHSWLRANIAKFRCRDCGHVFNIFSGTALRKTKFSCSTIVMILRGFAKGQTTASLARELAINRSNLLALRHRLQDYAFQNRVLNPLEDQETQTDEAYQNAGEKGRAHTDPTDPPRKRANKKRGSAISPMTDLVSWEP